MSVLIDTSVVIDVLRGAPEALAVLEEARGNGRLHASEITRAEVLAGMRAAETARTLSLLAVFTWHPVDQTVSERAGALARVWLPSHRGIDIADFLIAATSEVLDANLLTKNVKHFPMIAGLQAPY